mmetsp:Transcript_30316/g.55398  ORF Transcript_30316/g.55398 Transcript_30316/m.55398 type:complete len:644 (-) Transcript_30316:901-2832(-)|eukprot:CAMPEP_0175042036 /NCGR_PEP_ID=MMETSP0052_2-20121109/2301_1 /TAXON_ID=51329 ORGANISM="Polytomella parva, Strain SAG 63-3" /NCGR_SAMPLE_ID=MMETSP0052_2 /ASSEMBLY_ACC=CAM_ASM_000194 /LENGTH=643 /DNA_ID=CAMNT_0016304725 /DNA_START=26 /DNA_END=1957 /DNA_ORIENTATION=+
MENHRRIDVLSKQLTSATCGSGPCLKQYDFCPKELAKFITHDNFELRQKMFDFLKDPLYRPDYKMEFMAFRQLTLDRLKKFTGQNFFHLSDYINNPRRFMAALEALGYCDYSLCIKAGVHYTLCGGTVCRLGTRVHHQKYVQRINDLDLPGCFAMTEVARGSNVMGIETTATYDAATREFIINTPNDIASKYWIGGSAQHAKVTVAFAQLTVDNIPRGVHVFVVRLRDDTGKLMPGVRITDHGAKQGLNGVDNGRIWFTNVRIPREDLLNGFADVSEQGVYSSPIASPAARFGTTVSGLTTGRVLVASAAVDAIKMGLTIAIRYGAARDQFDDKMIISYITHQDRLFPHLAAVYAYHFGVANLKELLDPFQTSNSNPANASVDAALAASRLPDAALSKKSKSKDVSKAIHVVSSGLKAAATWTRIAALQNCRECCGGFGFLSQNKIGPLLNDMNVDVTFEGDNTVMMMQVAKTVLEDPDLARKPAVAPVPEQGFSLSYLAKLLKFREHVLAQQVVAAGREAGKDALEKNLDIGIQIGWATIEVFCLEALTSAARDKNAGPAGPALLLLAQLYGLTRVRDSLATYLATGALSRDAGFALRKEIVSIYGVLAADNAALAKRLCDGFGIPDHLLQAPIAFDWKKIL